MITLCNNFITESTHDKISSAGISGTDANDIRRYRAEARLIRAFHYFVLMDLFGNVPFDKDGKTNELINLHDKINHVHIV